MLRKALAAAGMAIAIAAGSARADDPDAAPDTPRRPRPSATAPT